MYSGTDDTKRIRARILSYWRTVNQYICLLFDKLSHNPNLVVLWISFVICGSCFVFRVSPTSNGKWSQGITSQDDYNQVSQVDQMKPFHLRPDFHAQIISNDDVTPETNLHLQGLLQSCKKHKECGRQKIGFHLNLSLWRYSNAFPLREEIKLEMFERSLVSEMQSLSLAVDDQQQLRWLSCKRRAVIVIQIVIQIVKLECIEIWICIQVIVQFLELW